MESSSPNLERERWKLTARIIKMLDRPMLALSIVWSILLIVELTYGLSPSLQHLNDAIWGTFIVQFLVEFAAAPRKRLYLRRHWITLLSLVLPMFRLLRLARLARAGRVARAARGIRLARVIAAMNRGMKSISRGFKRRGLGYLTVLTLLVAVIGAAGMYRFELEAAGGPGYESYADALWWTAMLLTTMGSQYWPQTSEGRFLCLLMSVYAFAVFGYVTAAIAAYFIGDDRQRDPASVGRPAGEQQEVSRVSP